MTRPTAATALLMLGLIVALGACGETADTETTELVDTAAPAPTVAARPETETSEVDEPEETTQAGAASGELTYPIVDTGQTAFYDNTGEIETPGVDNAFYGQDAAYEGNQPSYTDNGDGTVTDNVTGLMWAQTPIQNITYDEATEGAADFKLAGYDDWRLPSIKELYSLILFTGTDPSGCDETGVDCQSAVPFIDTDYFDFEYGDTSARERLIDAQYASSTVYVGDGFGELAFGVNFADGRIKGYGLMIRGTDKTFDVLYVRGATNYGVNEFVDNGDETITDSATGLVWTQADSGTALSWDESISYCSALETAGIDSWRLPSVKELQSIVDYTRSPGSSNSAAIDPLFDITEIVDEGGEANYPYLWSSTTHASLNGGRNAAYVAFGEALGWMNIGGEYSLVDVHGAGAQRSDPKLGDADQYPYGHGPQGDVIRVDNYALCVADA